MTRRNWRPWAAALALASVPCGCSPGGGGALGLADDPAAARLDELEDTRAVEASAWRPLLASETGELRRRAARAVGRVRDRSLAPLLVSRLAVESDAPVRGELLFALGQLGDESSRELLESAAGSNDATERAAALEALGKLGGTVSLPTLVGALADEDANAAAAAAYALTRTLGRRVEPAPRIEPAARDRLLEALERSVASGVSAVREAAAYALSEIALEGREAALAALLEDREASTRLFAVRGVARSNAAADHATALVSLLADPSPHVAAAAAGALAEVPGERARDALLAATARATRPEDFHLRAAAVRALGVSAGPPDASSPPLVVDALRARLADMSPTVRRAALVELARLAPAESLRTVFSAAADTDAWTRAAAARAAELLPESESWAVLEPLLADDDPRVAAAALEAAGSSSQPVKERLRAVALAALEREDIAVRAVALGLLARGGSAGDASAILDVLESSTGDENAEIRIEALSALARIDPAAARHTLERATSDPSPAVAGRAAGLLSDLTGRAVRPRSDSTRRSSVSLVLGRDALSTAPNPRAEIETDKGTLVLELLREDAPRHVKSFVDLSRRGFFDGLSVHRVVTGFVVQGLDPRGDGWGTGGVFLRDEINRAPFHAGVAGMPNAGPDTAGCQIFLTHVPTPHLDGRYTVFARVQSGNEVLDRLEVGDVVRSVSVR